VISPSSARINAHAFEGLSISGESPLNRIVTMVG